MSVTGRTETEGRGGSRSGCTEARAKGERHDFKLDAGACKRTERDQRDLIKNEGSLRSYNYFRIRSSSGIRLANCSKFEIWKAHKSKMQIFYFGLSTWDFLLNNMPCLFYICVFLQRDFGQNEQT